jgi:hypothetical protein
VQNALEALREFPKHAGLTSFIATAASQAWTFATQARARAEAAGNDVMLSPGYQEGLRRFEEANRLQRAGRPADAAPGYLSAASQFERAKRDAQQQVAVNARPGGATPSSSAPASKPADVVARDDRTSVSPPAPAPEPERKSAEPERKTPPSERSTEPAAPAPRQPANADTPASIPTQEQSAATISRMLKAYEAAFNSRDVQGLRAIWPGVPDDFFARLTRQMGDIKALSIGLNGCQVTTKATTGSVICRETGVAVDRFGRPHALPDRPRSFDVQSTGSGWIITARR